MWTFEEIHNHVLDHIDEARCPGIYRVFAPEGFDIVFNAFTDAVKDTNNIKPVDLLMARLQMISTSKAEEEKRVLYIGKTNASLKERVFCFARYGYGEVKNHRGGYPIWQIKDNKKLLVEIYPYNRTGMDPCMEETTLLDKYVDIYGTEPLANTAVGRNSKYKYLVKEDRYVLK